MPFSKRLLDIAFALPAIALLSPLLLVVAARIKIEDPGPVFFKQPRYGLGGKVFNVYKFRSMTHQPDAKFEQAKKGDARVTRIGAFIRRTSIDELPQLFNVLKGEMSLVGPRPHPLDLDDNYSKKIPNLMARYSLTPGITGWAQINGSRGETRTVDDMETRVNYDLDYIEHRNFSMDLNIILRTAFGGWTDPNAY